MQLEDDILCFLPTVSDIDVFGCEVDLIDFATQLPLPAAFHTALNEGSYKLSGFKAWQGCQQLQIVKLPSSVLSLEDGAFQGCHALREVVAPGCVQYSRTAFAECCSLSRVGVSRETAMSLHQERSWADMLLRAASRLHPSPLQWTKPTRRERCLKVRFAERVLKPSVSQATFTTLVRGLVKTASDLWKSISCAQISQPSSSPLRPMRGHDPHLAAATPNANRQRSFPQLHSAPRGGHSDRAARNRHSGLLWARAIKVLYSP